MHDLGETRSRNRHDHRLQTPDTFVRTPLPCLSGGVAVVHAAPSLGCSFAQYTVEFGMSGGTLRGIPGLQRFLYLLDGEASIARPDEPESLLQAGSFAYLGPEHRHTLLAPGTARVAVIEQSPASAGDPVAALFGEERSLPSTPLLDDLGLAVRTLLPETLGLDFAVNTMTYQPGASLPIVEVHIMEHGLLMLEGGGIYRLGDCWYPVHAGDFIWMAPFCPQWFGALGRQPAKYLIYKDWNRHPIVAAAPVTR